MAGIHEVIVVVARTPPGRNVENHQWRRGGDWDEDCSNVGRTGRVSRESAVSRYCNGGRLFGAPALPKPAAATQPGLTSDRRAFPLHPKQLGAASDADVPCDTHGFRALSERSVIAGQLK